jgi:hypothetical protein
MLVRHTVAMPPPKPFIRLLTVLLAGPATGGCALLLVPPALDLAAIPVLHRDLFDAIYSDMTGKDCSLVRLDEFKTYCRPTEPGPTAPPYCTRSLGSADCWVDPQKLQPEPPQVADQALKLTPAQEADRTRGWPPL